MRTKGGLCLALNKSPKFNVQNDINSKKKLLHEMGHLEP